MQMNYLSKLTLIGLLIFLSLSPILAQKKGRFGPFQKVKKNRAETKFEQSQWWIGAKFGGSWTQAQPGTRFTPFSSTFPVNSNPNPGLYDKKYQDFKQLGAFSGVVITFFHKGFSISLQPNYRRLRYRFNNDYLWTDPKSDTFNLTLNYEFEQKLDYLDIPLLVKYDIMRTRFRPFVQVGGYYSHLINANLKLNQSGIDRASGNVSQFNNPSLDVGNKDYFIKSSLGIFGGLGLSWDVGNVRLSLEGNYRLGFNNIAKSANRYFDNRLASIGYAPDNVKLRNIEFAFSCLFPMRFLVTKNFKAVD